MSLHLEFGLKGYAVLVLKLGPTSNTPSYLNLAIPPSHLVVLLAIYQVVTILWVLLQTFHRWKTGSSGSNISISTAIFQGWPSVIETTKRGFLMVLFRHQGLLQPSIPKEEKVVYNTQQQSPLLSFPAEIRMMIYRNLLLSTNPDHKLDSPDFLVSAKRRGLLLPTGYTRSRYNYYATHPDNRERSGTHAALLRTCRKVYEEAIGVLYGENVFGFESIDGIEVFKEEGLETACDQESRTTTPLFKFQPKPQGRCALIRHLALRFGGHSDEGMYASSARYYTPKKYDEGPSWSKFIHNARPFIDRFKTTAGLSTLTIAGIDI